MIGLRRAAASLLLAALAGVGGSNVLGAQSVTLALSSLQNDSTSPAPVMTVTGFENRPELGPYSVSLVLSLESQFRAPFYNNAAEGENATFTVDSLLPEHAIVYFRARLSDKFGAVVAEQRTQHPVHSWLHLISPLRGPTTIVPTRAPRFVWSSPAITLPPGLWVYELSVINTRTGITEFSQPGLTDTTFVFDSLESNASYHWQVRARAQNGPPSDTVTVTSPGTFVIGASPTATIFYPTFPNPFGRTTRSPTACFWFDLARQATVKLTIYDLRLREVRRIVPGPIGAGSLLGGEYGRENTSLQTGCDPRLSWDGTDGNGRPVPPGVYVAVFEADGVRQSYKIVFRGQ